MLGALVLWFDGLPDANQIAFSRALSGSAAVALETRQLIAEQKRLFEAFIQVIADAIDAKSPYTGGHCARVPEIAKLLAAAACGADEGPFAQYQLNADQWEALHVAAWLHDCGKVTTPDHVVDKATKLETVHDRIHEIRMRFELLKSEAETEHWRRIASGADPEASQQSLDASWSRLDDDFAFVAACNLGGERMAPERIGRLRAIASRTWRRSLDDRLGLGPEELRRRQRQPAPALPVREPLLADRADHLIERPERDRIAPDNPWGFAMEVPDYLYNLGELHNLTVERGTLSPEDRFKINEHMVQTIRMLSALPFPRHLAAVPEIAGAHHETLDGRGYPRRLRGEQMGVLARVMAIADIFEALTAADRPYKRGLKLSEALAIMARMVQEQHIDSDLFDLFLSSEVYLGYAQRHMEPAQIDGVDREALLAIAQASPSHRPPERAA
jgi:HD-GYP domain-containing protein (c-di-GMP phosphodiesterase class II)